tara:strand:+ start:524 stop:721 length:198 start_codon:yes stop_codon:yes gene_type:complete
MNKIKQVIWDSGYRQNYITEKMNIQQSVLSMWINESRKPNKERMKQLCKLLNCKPKDLYPEGMPK